MPKYRKRPIEINAVQFTGGNTAKVCAFIADSGGPLHYRTNTHPTDATKDEIFIRTLEGEMRAADGDWIIRGVAGEFYPCRDDIFRQTYEQPAPEPATGQADIPPAEVIEDSAGHPWLACRRCHEELEVIENGDWLETVVLVARQHVCPEQDGDQPTTPTT